MVGALLAAEALGKQGISNRLWNQLVPEPADKVALLQVRHSLDQCYPVLWCLNAFESCFRIQV